MIQDTGRSEIDKTGIDRMNRFQRPRALVYVVYLPRDQGPNRGLVVEMATIPSPPTALGYHCYKTPNTTNHTFEQVTGPAMQKPKCHGIILGACELPRGVLPNSKGRARPKNLRHADCYTRRSTIASWPMNQDCRSGSGSGSGSGRR